MITEFTILKIKCTQEMIGKDIIISASEEGQEALKSMPPAEKMACVIKYKGKHNLDRHDLFHACVKLVSENTGRREIEVKEHCKRDCRWFSGYVYYKDKFGKERVDVITKSISFAKMSLQEADEFYEKAFDILAGYLKLSSEVLINEAKLRMQGKYYCVVCGEPASQRHHCFSQSKPNIEKYGKKVIDADFNRRWVCINCHPGHGNIPPELIWDEKKFISVARKNGYLQDPEKEYSAEPEQDLENGELDIY
ncbi:hypothetical protein LCGC14_0794330 [marine sediment metagenome]|uniref:Uncharacterized protein n=1 Tax=marine sediment metagenome TaxID=412755 RepID=A0A0F9SBL7_9ZZZZ